MDMSTAFKQEGQGGGGGEHGGHLGHWDCRGLAADAPEDRVDRSLGLFHVLTFTQCLLPVDSL